MQILSLLNIVVLKVFHTFAVVNSAKPSGVKARTHTFILKDNESRLGRNNGPNQAIAESGLPKLIYIHI